MGLVCWWTWRHPERVPLLRHGVSPSQTVLVIGLDEGNRADALLLVYVHPSSVRVLILPRDTYCPGGRKLNGLYKRLGAQKFSQLCARIVGHPLEHFVVIPFSQMGGFLSRTFPDGLAVPVPYRLRYADRAAGFHYDLPAGTHRLRGQQLVWYLRDRYSDPRRRGEAARVERWQWFFQAALAELRRPQNLPRFPAIAADARRTFPTSLTLRDTASLALACLHTENLSAAYLPGRSIRLGRVGFVQLDKEAARRQARLARAGVLIPKGLTVWVLNGTAEPHLARSAARRLQPLLGVPCSVGNAPSAWEAVTTVTYTPDTLAPLAGEIAKELDVQGGVRQAANVADPPFIIVTLGRDYLKGVREVNHP